MADTPIQESASKKRKHDNVMESNCKRVLHSHDQINNRKRKLDLAASASNLSQNESGSITCFQINLNRRPTGVAELMTELHCSLKTFTSFIVFTQEPAVDRNSRVIGFSAGHSLVYSRTCERPRAALYCANNLNVWPMADFTSEDMATARVGTNEGEFIATSVYMDGNYENVYPDLLRKLLKYARKQRLELIIGTDCNAHSPMWGSPESNSRGERLEEFIANENLALCNIGRTPTFETAVAATIIDITLASPAMSERIHHWHVDTRFQCSDHHLVRFDLDLSPLVVKRRDFRGDKWSHFTQALPQVWNEPVMWSQETLDKEAESIQDVILEALDDTYPIKERRMKIGNVQWFNKEIMEAKRQLNRIKSRHHRLDTDETFEELRFARRQYNKLVKRLKWETWQTFCNSTETMEKMARLCKIVQRRENHTLELAEPKDSPERLVEDLVNEHFPDNQDVVEHAYDPRDWSMASIPFVDTEKTAAAFQSFHNFKAPGPDTIPPIAYKHLNYLMLHRITQCFKASLTMGYTPKVWRKSNVVFIPKPGKDNYSNVRSFRPISLSNFIFKALERVVLWHLEATALVRNPLNKNQNAFRKGRSTETALTCMVDKLESAVKNKKYALGVFLDIQGAFDNVNADSVIRGMKAKGFDRKIVNWFGWFLKNRTISINYKGCSLERNLVKGTPQGGVLSPLMWNLVFDSLLDLYNDGPTVAYGYADDAGLVTCGEDIRQLHMYMQRDVNKAIEWGKANGLTFSESKTVAVIFTQKQKRTYWKLCAPCKIKINGKEIAYNKEVRYLGIQLDSKLTWRKHIEMKVRNAKIQLVKLRNAMGKLWGAPPNMMKWAYTGVVRPALTYGALVWARAAESKWAQQEFTKLNRLAMLAMGHFRRSTPTAGMEVINYVRPLRFQILHEASMGYKRTFAMHNGKKSSAHLVHASKLWEGFPFPEVDEGEVTFNWGKKFCIDADSFSSGEPTSNGTLTVYTDGSVMNEHAGSGFHYQGYYGESGEFSYSLGTDRSVFQAEVFAIAKAAEHLIEQSTTQRRITFCIDSQAAIKALFSPKVNKKCVRTAVSCLNHLGQQNEVTLSWIKSHVGHSGNEKADALAKQGAVATDEVAADRPLISTHIIKNRVRDLVDGEWNKQWMASLPCRQTKLFFPQIDRLKSNGILKLRRKDHSLLSQLFTGHSFLNRHSALMDNEIDPACQLCGLGDEQTAHHILAICPKFQAARRMIFGSHVIWQSQPWSVMQVLHFCTEISLSDLCDHR
jgi:ribonuclease HI